MRLEGLPVAVTETALLICIHPPWIAFLHHIITGVRHHHEGIVTTTEEDTMIDNITIEALLRNPGAEDHHVGAPRGMKIASSFPFVPMKKKGTG